MNDNYCTKCVYRMIHSVKLIKQKQTFRIAGFVCLGMQLCT